MVSGRQSTTMVSILILLVMLRATNMLLINGLLSRTRVFIVHSPHLKTKPLVFVEGTPQADLSHDCTDGTENVDDTSCGNDADAYGNNSSNNANAYGVT